MNLSSKLWQLTKQTIVKSSHYCKSEKMVIQKRLYVRDKVISFEYNKGNINYGKSFEEITKEEWETRNHFEFIEKEIKTLQLYSQILEDISKSYQVSKPQADFWLSRFIQLATVQFKENLSDEGLVDRVSNFISDLNKGPFTWQSKIWIDGVWLSDNSYQILEDLKIRKPKKEDLENDRPIDLLIASPAWLETKETASAIIELNYRTDKQLELSSEIEAIINSLRLFRTGSVNRVRITSTSDSILNFGGVQFSTLSKSKHYTYQLSKNDLGILTKVVKLIKPKLIKLKTNNLNPINIALKRYEDAILGQGTIESRATSAISCLEALFLKPEERSELSGRLSQRVAVLLRVEDKKPLEVQRDLLRAYEIRSTFIHGSTLSGEQQEKVKTLVDKVVDYARISILILLILDNEASKIEIINKIDNSLLDNNVKEAFTKLLETGYKDKVSK